MDVACSGSGHASKPNRFPKGWLVCAGSNLRRARRLQISSDTYHPDERACAHNLVSGGHFRLYAVSPNASIFRDMLLSRVKRSRNGYFSGLMTEEAVDLNPRIRSGWVPLGKLRFQAQEQEKLSQREKTSRQ